MANINAIAAICEAIKQVLESTIESDATNFGLGALKPGIEIVCRAGGF